MVILVLANTNVPVDHIMMKVRKGIGDLACGILEPRMIRVPSRSSYSPNDDFSIDCLVAAFEHLTMPTRRSPTPHIKSKQLIGREVRLGVRYHAMEASRDLKKLHIPIDILLADEAFQTMELEFLSAAINA